MSSNIEHLVSANQSAIDSHLSLGQIVIDSIEQISALNLSSSRTLLNDQVDHAKSLLGIKSPQEAVALHSEPLQPGSDRLIAYSRAIYAIAAKTQEEIARLIERQQVEWNKSVSSFIDTFSKSAPSGSDVAVAAVKSAVSAANSAFESVNKASRQVASITEASLAAANNAAARAVSSASAASRKKAA